MKNVNQLPIDSISFLRSALESFEKNYKPTDQINLIETSKPTARKPRKKAQTPARAPRFYLAASDGFFFEGDVKDGMDAKVILERFKKNLLEKEEQAIKYQQIQNERRAKANRLKEEQAAEDN